MKKKVLLCLCVSMFVLLFTGCETLFGFNTDENNETQIKGWTSDGQNTITKSIFDEDGFDYFGFDVYKVHYKTKTELDEQGNNREFYKYDYSKYKPYKIYYTKKSTSIPSTSGSLPKIMHTGPRGGQYYINSKGNKVYKKRK